MAWRPSLASPTTSISGMMLSSATRPCRTTGWSSTTRMRIRSAIVCCTFLRNDGGVQPDGGALFLRAFYGELSVNLSCALAHSLKAEVAFAGKGVILRMEASALVRDD